MTNRRRSLQSNPGDPAHPATDLSKIDLGKYQIATIPTELQLELAALERPLLSPEALIPPPPLGGPPNATETTEIDIPSSMGSSPPARSRKPYWIMAGVGAALLIFIIGWGMGKLTGTNAEPRHFEAATADSAVLLRLQLELVERTRHDNPDARHSGAVRSVGVDEAPGASVVPPAIAPMP